MPTVGELRATQQGLKFSRLANNATTTGQILVDSGLSFAISPNEICEFEFVLRIGSTGTAGMKLGLAFPVGAVLTASTGAI